VNGSDKLCDEDIIERLKNGDKNQLVSVIEKYKKMIISLCYSYTQDYGEAEDLSQEVFISFYKSINNFRGDSKISTYLYRITVNKCITYKKKRSVKMIFSGLFSHGKEEGISVIDRNEVRQAVRDLPEELKNPIILYYYLGLSYKEISDVLEISERAVEGRIYRGKNKLKDKLNREEEELWGHTKPTI